MVAAIMGLMAGLAAISLRGLRTPALSSAANEVASAVKMTRQMAIASGRNMYLLVPVQTNALTTNPYRTYAIFEEVKPGEEMRTPDAQGAYATNTNSTSWFIPQTDWRLLPEGVVFYSLMIRTNAAVPVNEMEFGSIGKPEDRAGNFQPLYTNMAVRRASDPASIFQSFDTVPYLMITPAGRFYTANYTEGLYGGVLQIVLGVVRDSQIVVTDTNNFFAIETDAQIGRVRVRTPESYQEP